MPKILATVLKKTKVYTKKKSTKKRVIFKIDVLEYFLDLWNDIDYEVEEHLYVQLEKHCKLEVFWLKKGRRLGFVKKVYVNIHDDYFLDVYLNYEKIVQSMSWLKQKEYNEKREKIEHICGKKIKNILLN